MIFARNTSWYSERSLLEVVAVWGEVKGGGTIRGVATPDVVSVRPLSARSRDGLGSTNAAIRQLDARGSDKDEG